MPRLTKAEILAAGQYTETVTVPSLDGEVTIRRLNAGETSQLTALGARGITLRVKQSDSEDVSEEDIAIDLDLPAMLAAQREQQLLTCAFGLSVPDGDSWTLEDVKAITPASAGDPIEEIALEVWRISGIDPEDLRMSETKPRD